MSDGEWIVCVVLSLSMLGLAGFFLASMTGDP